MATVKIGGKELRVLTMEEPGSFRRDVDLARLGEELAASKGNVESFTKMAEMVLAYLRCNEGVTLEWVMDALPANVTSVLSACAEATGRKVRKVVSEGEAKAPETRT